jgi:methionyl-tRNA synthetase
VLDPFAVMEQYGIDPLRFYLLREVTLGQDGSISLEGFEQRYTNELANELGNLVSRTVSMIGKYRGGAVPAASGVAGLAAEGAAAVAAWRARVAEIEITSGLEAVWEFVRRLNRFVEEEAPWKLAKDDTQAAHLDDVLFSLVAGVRLISLCLFAVMPATAVEILRRLGQPHVEADLQLALARWELAASAPVEQAPPLFPRIMSEV